MEKNQFKTDIEKQTVTMCHECQTSDGKILLTQTFDFSKVDAARKLFFMGADRKIAWRSNVGIKDITTKEAEKFNNITIDCSATVQRVKHVETAEEKELKALVKAAIAGGAKSIAELKAAVLAAQKTVVESEPTDDEYSAGETTKE